MNAASRHQETSSLRTLAHRLRLGKIVYEIWHRPRSALTRSRREGGPWQQWLDRRGRREMEAAARYLSPGPVAPQGAPEVVFLTGKKFWYQTAFCCRSLQQQAGNIVRPVFLDDGTLDDALHAECLRIFPGAMVRDRAAIEQQLDSHLPWNRFPSLRGQRETYIHLRKLTDAHVGASNWRVVLDSDMLFFRRPVALMHWLKEPTKPVHMIDVQDCYGYPTSSLEKLAGGNLPSKVNVGICGLRSDTIDWPQLEAWCEYLLQRHGTSYYLEQALVALYFSRESPVRLPAEDYRLMPDEDECRAPRATMHHYVDLSKRGYFRYAWRNVKT